MKWSLNLGKIAGIDVKIHITFLLIIGWVAMAHWQRGQTLAAAAAGVVFILALFACVVAHEFGHALTARKYGIKTRDITLLPIGGVARLERMPDNPREELWVALAGPAVNLVLAAGLFLWLIATATLVPFGQLTVASGAFAERLLVANIFLAVFNMLPAFPMDGGRVVRALLAMRMNYARATQVAANIGQGMAFVFGFIGLFYNPFLVFIALFVWIGASQEASMAQLKASLGGIPVSHAMITNFQTVAPTDRISRAVELILAGSQRDFPVTDDTGIIGILERDRILAALAQGGLDTLVAEEMARDFQSADAQEMLDAAFLRLQTCGCHTMPVLRGKRLAGLLTAENVGEFIMIQSALQGRGSR